MTPDPGNPYGIQVTTSPGGLSQTAHILNVIVVLCTGGLWLLPYLLIVLLAPKRTAQVYAPPGTPQVAIEAARAAAVELTPAEAADRRRTLIGFGIFVGVVFLACIGVWLWGTLT